MTVSEELVEKARAARDDAYAPYSDFHVGAALLTASGDVYTGGNVKNINYTNTGHAEQNALHAAVLDGHREFEAIAISCSGEPVPPCGLCRQSLSEFCDEDFLVIVDDYGDYEYVTFELGFLLPGAMEDIS